jgi:ureidoacrylate peracid hydrolase
MHDPRLPQDVIDRVIARRGRLNAYEALNAASTALLVVDLQTAFMGEGLPSEVPLAREIVPNVNRLAEAVRGTGGAVFWIQVTTEPKPDGGWPTFYDHMVSNAVAEKIARNLNDGSKPHELWPELDVRDDDQTILKYRYSALVRGSSELDELLQERGIDTVLVTGTMTNVCCESTARDAMQMGYKTVMVSDANAARSDAEHTATLVTFILSFGDVRPTAEVITLLEAGAAGNIAAQ